MIYRIIVDYRHHASYSIPTNWVLTGRSLKRLSSLPEDVLARLKSMKSKKFGTKEEFMQELEELLGPEHFETYGLTVYVSAAGENNVERYVAEPWKSQEDRKMLGASFGWFNFIMEVRGLRSPNITNPRARFYFTELGWEKVGRYVASEARQVGHVVKVIKR